MFLIRGFKCNPLEMFRKFPMDYIWIIYVNLSPGHNQVQLYVCEKPMTRLKFSYEHI